MNQFSIEAPGFRLLDFVGRHSAITPSAPALWFDGDKPWSYGDVYTYCKQLQTEFHALGFSSADRVAFLLPKTMASVLVMLALTSATPCLILDPLAKEDEIAYALQVAAAKVVIATPDHATALSVTRQNGLPLLWVEPGPRLAPAAGETLSPRRLVAGKKNAAADNSPIACIFLTSGTTNRPKIVPFTHRQIANAVMRRIPWLQLGSEDRTVHMWAMHHIAGWGNLLLPLLAVGGSIALLPEFQAARLVEFSRQARPTCLNAPAVMLQAIMDHLTKHPDSGEAFLDLRFISSGGAALTANLTKEMEKHFRVPVLQAYGMTETFGVTTSNPLPPQVRKPESVGLPYPGIEIALCDGNGTAVEPGETGEIRVRGDSVSSGYLGNPEVTSAVFVDGWYRTGDLGWIDPDGYLQLKGRVSDLINRGGKKISPQEVDEALLRLPGIRETASFAMPHARLGEDIACAIVIEPGVNLSNKIVRSHLRQQLTAYKVPNRIIFVDMIPKTPTGKIRRNELYKLLAAEYPQFFTAGAARLACGQLVAPRNEVEAKLVAIWRNLLNFAEIGVEDDFFALGGDSLQATELLCEIELNWGLALPTSSLIELSTISRLAEQIMAARAELPDVVTIQPAGSKPPLFCIHTFDGDVQSYKSLVSYLGKDQPVYGVRFPSRLEISDSCKNIEQLAAHYIELIRSVQKQSPYLLAGYSFGGFVVYEMARQLSAAGYKVGLLALFDTGIPKSLVERVSKLWLKLQNISWCNKGNYLFELILKKIDHFQKTSKKSKKLLNLLRNYKLGEYVGQVVLFNAIEKPAVDSDITMGWGRYLKGNLHIEKVPGDHLSMITEPHVRVLAKRLRKYLERTEPLTKEGSGLELNSAANK